MTEIGVTGAAGRMGREVLSAAADREGIDVAFAVNRSSVNELVSGVVVESSDNVAELLAEYEPDVIVDFTGPESALTYADACADHGVALVTGTTGFDDGGLDALQAAGESTAVLKASNFSRGVAALRLAVQEATAALPDADIELTETHHNAKRDAPSGTAKTLLDDIEGVRNDVDERVHGREGEAPRSDDEIGVHARRAGDIAGEHEVLLAGSNETLSLTHRAGDRSIFAEGALDAAEWLAGREPGWYDFFEVIDDA
jgi:dihydrodipicolinate reductase (EC 1.3.1.26)